jgi:hypothetical protein
MKAYDNRTTLVKSPSKGPDQVELQQGNGAMTQRNMTSHNVSGTQTMKYMFITGSTITISIRR